MVQSFRNSWVVFSTASHHYHAGRCPLGFVTVYRIIHSLKQVRLTGILFNTSTVWSALAFIIDNRNYGLCRWLHAYLWYLKHLRSKMLHCWSQEGVHCPASWFWQNNTILSFTLDPLIVGNVSLFCWCCVLLRCCCFCCSLWTDYGYRESFLAGEVPVWYRCPNACPMG